MLLQQFYDILFYEKHYYRRGNCYFKKVKEESSLIKII